MKHRLHHLKWHYVLPVLTECLQEKNVNRNMKIDVPSEGWRHSCGPPRPLSKISRELLEFCIMEVNGTDYEPDSLTTIL